jgi:hypothetical protein
VRARGGEIELRRPMDNRHQRRRRKLEKELLMVLQQTKEGGSARPTGEKADHLIDPEQVIRGPDLRAWTLHDIPSYRQKEIVSIDV